MTATALTPALSSKPVYQDGVDFVPAFLTQAEADELLSFMKAQPFANGRISYGLQIHPILKKNRPGDVWAKNIRPEPDFIQSLRVRVSEKYGVPFNSVQCNWHTGESEVSEHYDPYRVISMIRVGCTRVFEVGGQRQQGKDMYKYKPYPMPHGSLITFLSGGLTHRMFPEPSVGDCLSIIFRLVTPGQTTADWYPTDKLTYSKTRALHKKIYDGKVSEYRAKAPTATPDAKIFASTLYPTANDSIKDSSARLTAL
jgi:hypothetical protein